MKKTITLLLFYFITLSVYSQITDGLYKVVGYRTLIKGETIDDNVFSNAILRVSNNSQIAILRIDGFAVATFVLESPVVQNDQYSYKATEYYTNSETIFVYVPHVENGIKLNGGMLMHLKSNDYMDVFAIVKTEEEDTK